MLPSAGGRLNRRTSSSFDDLLEETQHSLGRGIRYDQGFDGKRLLRLKRGQVHAFRGRIGIDEIGGSIAERSDHARCEVLAGRDDAQLVGKGLRFRSQCVLCRIE